MPRFEAQNIKQLPLRKRSFGNSFTGKRERGGKKNPPMVGGARKKTIIDSFDKKRVVRGGCLESEDGKR